MFYAKTKCGCLISCQNSSGIEVEIVAMRKRYRDDSSLAITN